MAKSNPDIEAAIKKLREKAEHIEQGDPPVGEADQQPGKPSIEVLEVPPLPKAVTQQLEANIAAIQRACGVVDPDTLNLKPGGWIEVPRGSIASGKIPEEVIENAWAALDKAQFITGAWADMSFSDIPEDEQEKFAKIIGDAKELELPDREEMLREEIDRLLDLLRRVALHVAARNALGEKSRKFCCACNNARHEECILPEVWKAVGEL